MDYQNLIKFERFPTLWCPGCSNGISLKATAQALFNLGFTAKNTVAVSGIGCAGRAAGYFNLDSVHTAHGRALAVAEGIVTVNPELKVVVYSGDGDLLGIGGNHLLHLARRDSPLTVILIHNEIYGMTGGQMAPTTPKGKVTLTSPAGAAAEPINIQGLLTLNSHHFYARTSAWHFGHLKQCLEEALKWQGFSLVDVLSVCITNYGLRLGYKDSFEMLQEFKQKLKINLEKKPFELLKENELGIVKSEG